LFSKDIQTKVDNLLSRYPIKQNALIPILLLAQNENDGWLTEEWMQHVADICEVPLTHVEGVVTFYTMSFETSREIPFAGLYLRTMLPRWRNRVVGTHRKKTKHSRGTYYN